MPILQGAFDDAKKHYKRHGILGFVPPELRESASRVPQALRMGLDYIGPAADMQDMKNYSGATMDELQAGNYGPALANLGMTGAALAMTALPGNVGAIEKALKSDLDPRGFSNVKLDKPLNEVEVVAESTGENLPRKSISIEDIEGKVVIPLFGDRSSRGQIITEVDGLKFDKPVYTEGGVDFMVGPAAQADNAVWASKQNIATKLRNKAAKSADLTGADVVGAHITMAPDAVDFTNFGAATLAEMVKQSPITKKNAASFDKVIKRVAPTWPGVLSPDLRSFVENASPDVRKAFIREMDKAPWQAAGFPNPGKMRLAVSDPTQVDMDAGMLGLGVARIDPTAEAIVAPKIPHGTYNTQIRGDYMGGLIPIDQGLLFRDLHDSMAGKTTKAGLPVNAAHITHAMKTKIPGQLVTPEIVDDIMQRLERQK